MEKIKKEQNQIIKFLTRYPSRISNLDFKLSAFLIGLMLNDGVSEMYVYVDEIQNGIEKRNYYGKLIFKIDGLSANIIDIDHSLERINRKKILSIKEVVVGYQYKVSMKGCLK
ncbi:MAG: hypothetical protein JW870_04905 [Candidatus Delongbacteria bacterium]|nr:hypothetical protein [Candidatus Delongbacteria bacterium]